MEQLTIINLVILVYTLYCLYKTRELANTVQESGVNISKQADILIDTNQKIADELQHARDMYESINAPGIRTDSNSKV